jgi:hypothetical protein
VDLVDTVLESGRTTRVLGPLSHFEDYVAHVSTLPRVCVTNACSPDLCDHLEEFMGLLDFSIMNAHPRHKSTDGPVAHVALVSASVCVEPVSYKATLVSP